MRKKWQSPRQRSGQSTVEYILVVTAVVGVVLLLTIGIPATVDKDGKVSKAGVDPVFQTKLKSTITTTMDGMDKEANKLMNSIGL